MEQNRSQPRMTSWRAFLHAYATVIPILEREMQEDKGLSLTWYDVLALVRDEPSDTSKVQALKDAGVEVIYGDLNNLDTLH